MDKSHVESIQEWVDIDNKLLKHKEETKDLIERKKELETDILLYVEENKLDNLSLSITDGTIKFAKKTQTQILSIRTIKLIIEKYNNDNKKLKPDLLINIDNLCEYISLNLEKKNQLYMKRNIKDNI